MRRGTSQTITGVGILHHQPFFRIGDEHVVPLRFHHVVRRLDAPLKFVKTEGQWIEVAHDIDLGSCWNLIFQPHTPVHGIDEHAAKTFAFQVRCGTHRRHEDPTDLILRAAIGSRSGHRHHGIILRTFHGSILGVNRKQHRTLKPMMPREDFSQLGQPLF